MPKDAWELKNFNQGIVSNADARDIPEEAALYSKNIDSNSPGGVLTPNRHNVFKEDSSGTANDEFSRLRIDSGVSLLADSSNTDVTLDVNGFSDFKVGDYIGVGKSVVRIEGFTGGFTAATVALRFNSATKSDYDNYRVGISNFNNDTRKYWFENSSSHGNTGSLYTSSNVEYVIVRIDDLSGSGDTLKANIASELKEAIEHANGHNGTINCSITDFTLTLTQNQVGWEGNHNISFFDGYDGNKIYTAQKDSGYYGFAGGEATGVINVSGALFGSLQESGNMAEIGEPIYKLILPKEIFSYVKDGKENLILVEDTGRMNAIQDISSILSGEVGAGLNSASGEFKNFPFYINYAGQFTVAKDINAYFIGTGPNSPSMWMGKYIASNLLVKDSDSFNVTYSALIGPGAIGTKSEYSKIITYSLTTTSAAGTVIKNPRIDNESGVFHVAYIKGENYIYIIDGDTGATHRSIQLEDPIYAIAKVTSCRTAAKVWVYTRGESEIEAPDVGLGISPGRITCYQIFDFSSGDSINLRSSFTFPGGVSLSRHQVIDCKWGQDANTGYVSGPIYNKTAISEFGYQSGESLYVDDFTGHPMISDILETVDSSGNGKLWMSASPNFSEGDNQNHKTGWFRQAQQASGTGCELHRHLWCSYSTIDGDESGGLTSTVYFNDKSMPLHTLYDSNVQYNNPDYKSYKNLDPTNRRTDTLRLFYGNTRPWGERAPWGKGTTQPNYNEGGVEHVSGAMKWPASPRFKAQLMKRSVPGGTGYTEPQTGIGSMNSYEIDYGFPAIFSDEDNYIQPGFHDTADSDTYNYMLVHGGSMWYQCYNNTVGMKFSNHSRGWYQTQNSSENYVTSYYYPYSSDGTYSNASTAAAAAKAVSDSFFLKFSIDFRGGDIDNNISENKTKDYEHVSGGSGIDFYQINVGDENNSWHTIFNAGFSEDIKVDFLSGIPLQTDAWSPTYSIWYHGYSDNWKYTGIQAHPISGPDSALLFCPEPDSLIDVSDLYDGVDHVVSSVISTSSTTNPCFLEDFSFAYKYKATGYHSPKTLIPHRKVSIMGNKTMLWIANGGIENYGSNYVRDNSFGVDGSAGARTGDDNQCGRHELTDVNLSTLCYDNTDGAEVVRVLKFMEDVNISTPEGKESHNFCSISRGKPTHEYNVDTQYNDNNYIHSGLFISYETEGSPKLQAIRLNTTEEQGMTLPTSKDFGKGETVSFSNASTVGLAGYANPDQGDGATEQISATKNRDFSSTPDWADYSPDTSPTAPAYDTDHMEVTATTADNKEGIQLAIDKMVGRPRPGTSYTISAKIWWDDGAAPGTNPAASFYGEYGGTSAVESDAVTATSEPGSANFSVVVEAINATGTLKIYNKGVFDTFGTSALWSITDISVIPVAATGVILNTGVATSKALSPKNLKAVTKLTLGTIVADSGDYGWKLGKNDFIGETGNQLIDGGSGTSTSVRYNDVNGNAAFYNFNLGEAFSDKLDIMPSNTPTTFMYFSGIGSGDTAIENDARTKDPGGNGSNGHARSLTGYRFSTPPFSNIIWSKHLASYTAGSFLLAGAPAFVRSSAFQKIEKGNEWAPFETQDEITESGFNLGTNSENSGGYTSVHDVLGKGVSKRWDVDLTDNITMLSYGTPSNLQFSTSLTGLSKVSADNFSRVVLAHTWSFGNPADISGANASSQGQSSVYAKNDYYFTLFNNGGNGELVYASIGGYKEFEDEYDTTLGGDSTGFSGIRTGETHDSSLGSDYYMDHKMYAKGVSTYKASSGGGVTLDFNPTDEIENSQAGEANEFADGVNNFPGNGERKYKISFQYDDIDGNESPLSIHSYVWSNSSTSNYKNMILGVSVPATLSKRISHINIYRKGDISQDTDGFNHHLVKSIPFKKGYVNLDTNTPWQPEIRNGYDVYKISVKDSFSMGESYEQRTGFNEIAASNSINYGISLKALGHLFVSHIKSPQFENGKTILLKSEYDKFSSFNVINRDRYFVASDEITAIASFRGFIYVFCKNVIHKVNPSNMFEEETLTGYGCLNQNMVVSTEYGMFFGDNAHIYKHDGTSVQVISYPIDTDDFSGNSAGYQNKTSGPISDSNARMYFLGKTNLLSIVWSYNGKGYGYTYNVIKGRWDQMDFSIEYNDALISQAVSGNVLFEGSQDRKVYYFAGPYTSSAAFANPYIQMTELSGGDNKSYFTWHSKKMTMGRDTTDKRFYKLKIEASAALTTTPTVYVDDLLTTLTAITGKTNEWKISSNSATGAKNKGRKIQIKLPSGNENITIYSMGIVHRMLSAK